MLKAKVSASEPEDAIHLEEWPPVPAEFRPRPLPHQGLFSAEDEAILVQRGYAPVDVRFVQGAAAVTAWMEGLRLGTLVASKETMAVLELEAKIYGLTGARSRGVNEKKASLAGADVESLIDTFASNRRYADMGVPNPEGMKSRAGRKKYSVNEKPRTRDRRAEAAIKAAKEST